MCRGEGVFTFDCVDDLRGGFLALADSFETVGDFGLIRVIGDTEIPSQDIFCCHYPMITWDQAHRGSWNIFGHIHTCKGQNMITNKKSPNQYDVGVDQNDYTPVSFQQLKEIITKQNLYGIL